MNPLPVRLNARASKRLRGGHPWIFANEIDGSVRELPPGAAVEVRSHTGAFIGKGHADPHHLVAIRLVSRDKREDVDVAAFFAGRLRRAVELRGAVRPGGGSMRIVDGEGDHLPGLAVDRYGDSFVVTCTTPGMKQRSALVHEALREVFEWDGSVPDVAEIEEYGAILRVGLGAGERHYFDQADNRRFASTLIGGLRLLDVYAGNGAWALQGLISGGAPAVLVEKKEALCERAVANAERNEVDNRLTVICDEGKKTLQKLRDMGERFGAVVLDPPPFAKTRNALKSGLKGYTEVNALALTLVQPGGFLFTSTRSPHVDDAAFEALLRDAAVEADRRIRVVRRSGAGPDHPVIPGVPETRRLRHLALYVTT